MSANWRLRKTDGQSQSEGLRIREADDVNLTSRAEEVTFQLNNAGGKKGANSSFLHLLFC